MALTSEHGGGTRSINKLPAFCEVLGGRVPSAKTEFTALFNKIDDAIRREYPAVTKAALGNAHGDWFEWLLAIAAWNSYSDGDKTSAALKLPNVSSFDCAELYEETLFGMIVHLRTVVRESSNVELVTSNPDFVIVSGEGLKDIPLPRPIVSVTPAIITELEKAYTKMIGKCSFESIHGYLAAKFSFRPDRRLQIPHEGSLMKALYVHLQTRLWITNPPGLKYYAVAAEVGPADIDALHTVATHSITTVSSLPQSAVDEVFPVSSLHEATLMFNKIL